ncbi:MAG: FAD-binding oxidoreductase [Candidatus Aenigmatarchaeota archaeon]
MADEQELYKMIKRDVSSRILEIRSETHDTKIFRLEAPPDFEFFPGQFIMLKVNIDEKRGFKIAGGKPSIQTRAYSIASSPTQMGTIDLLIKKRENGFVSAYLNDFANAGDKVTFSGPYGKFYFREGMAKHIVLLSAGCGISALMSMARYVADKKMDTRVTIVQSSRTPDDILFRKELEEMKNKGLANVVITLTRTKPEHGWKGHTGRITADLIKENVKDIEEAVFFICGMPEFSEQMTAMLRGLGVASERIRTERW